MLTGIYQSIAILAVIVLFYGLDFWLVHRYDPLRVEGSSKSWSYTTLAILAAALVIAQPIVWPGLGVRIEAWWGMLAQALGLLLILGALVLHGWARVHLGQFFGEREEVQAGQYLIESGPYAHIRHPLYTSYYIFAAGLVLVNPALTTLLAAVYAYVDFSLAIRREEKLLAEQLPGYADYMARTPRFLPGLYRRTERHES